jgi:hypothetical protein
MEPAITKPLLQDGRAQSIHRSAGDECPPIGHPRTEPIGGAPQLPVLNAGDELIFLR